MMSEVESKIIKEKFIQGVNLAIKRLIDHTLKENNGELVVSKNGVITRVKASELKIS